MIITRHANNKHAIVFGLNGVSPKKIHVIIAKTNIDIENDINFIDHTEFISAYKILYA